MDGFEIEVSITEALSELLLKKYNLEVITLGRTKDEKTISNLEGSYLRKGKVQSIIVEIRKKGNDFILTLRGSLHKFYLNDNSGAFWGYQICEAISKFCTTFKVDKYQASVLNIEFGVNIPVWFDVYPYLKENLIYHKKERFSEPKELLRKGFICRHHDYLLKMYAKQKRILRYEIKHTSTVELRNRFKISYLSDICESTLNELALNLVTEFEQVIMRDGLNILDKRDRYDGMPENEREKLLEFSSNLYQLSYRESLKKAVEKKKKESLRQKSYRLKMDCMRIIKTYGNQDHHRLLSLIADHVGEFLNSWHPVEEGGMSRFPQSIREGIRDICSMDIDYNINTNKRSIDPVKSNRLIESINVV